MKNGLKIAITGGIGSGKSTVMQILSNKGYNTVSFDAVYSELLQNEEYLKKLCKEFDLIPLEKNGKIFLDKQALSKKVFNNVEYLKKLNEFTHQSIFDKAFEMQSGKVTFYEVPLLFEGNYQDRFDKVWVIMREYNKRILDASKRDCSSFEEVELKANNQIDYENNDFSLHTVIVNDGNFTELESKVERALDEIFKK